MDFQGQRTAPGNSFLSGEGAELQLPPESVVLVRDSGVEFLSPQRLELFAEFDLDEATWALKDRVPRATQRSIAYYQTASYLYRTNAYRELTREEQERAARGMASAPVSSTTRK